MFCNSVYHLLEEADQKTMTTMTCLPKGSWSLTANSGKKGRDWKIYLYQNEDGTGVSMFVRHGSAKVPFDVRVDRITEIEINKEYYAKKDATKFSMESFKKDVFPLLRKMVCNCSITSRHELYVLPNFIYEQLKDLYCFKRIDIASTGEKSHQFMKNQLKNGNMISARFFGEGWPQSMEELFLPFFKSPMFRYLGVPWDLRLHFDVVSAFVDGSFDGQLRENACLTGPISFPTEDLFRKIGSSPQIKEESCTYSRYWKCGNRKITFMANSPTERIRYIHLIGGFP
uniref:Sulfotransfer_1 domain-containing protein n=1 Tax=Steinernema glaseri TaxID=37863 RepID=A0A1I7Y0X4_9BILA